MISRRASEANCPPASTRTASASEADGVISSAVARGSCSAWASRSAATSGGIRGIIGDEQRLGGAIEAVDAHVAIDQFFGQGDKQATGTDDLVHARDALGTIGQRGDRLRPAEQAAPAPPRPRGPRPGWILG